MADGIESVNPVRGLPATPSAPAHDRGHGPPTSRAGRGGAKDIQQTNRRRKSGGAALPENGPKPAIVRRSGHLLQTQWRRVMTIARKLNQFLNDQHADYELIAHDPTRSAVETAKVCHVPAWQMAKAVLLDTEQDYLLAVLPADRRLELAELRTDLGMKPHLAGEKQIAAIFDDCAFGAVPPIGTGYGVMTIIDDSLDEASDIYFEAGDHASLVHMSGAEFSRLTKQARRGHFCEASASTM